MGKQDLRERIKHRLMQIQEFTFEHKCKLIEKQVMSLSSWRKAQTVAITISRGTEIHTYPIIMEAWKQGKTIAVPKTYPKTKKMEFLLIDSFKQLKPTYFSLLEPVERCPLITKDKLDLVVVPGLAFERSGYRLGFGGGYYDRYLQDYNGDTISMAFEEQLVATVFPEQYDIPVSTIVTEKQIIHCR
ncbi:5-formyltetrahydrofolate cyclo-ligase [Bacillus alkalicellulosilyticus]|uniref:5-formyltetrahydrofolate cyclo-ligase n=1 Tax=Alkalihalobacterium alkalicellulosilyticum TaxID=1912214 RepID=UPI0009966462|nr:5-formyltetrahydrofolate cyclo-ligase [Bacillus alkalicellulosilyticus]